MKKKYALRIYIYSFAILTISALFFACDKPHQNALAKPVVINQEDRQWMSKFFKDLLLDEHGIFTLMGSKPLTLIILSHYTDEEIQAYYDGLTEEEKKNGHIIEKYDLPENWEKWEKMSSLFPMKRFMLFKSDLYEDPNATFVFFVDVLKTAMVIQENYEIFQKAVGFDFNPVEVVLEMKNKGSQFWGKVNGNSFLWGILFGYGKANAFAFHWKHFDHTKMSENFFESLNPTFSEQPLRGKVEITLKNFQIPAFVSFDDNDPIIDRYKKERERIQDIYKSRDFLDFTLQRLMN